MEEKIVVNVEETVVAVDEASVAAVSPTVEYKAKKGGAVMGIIGFCCAIVGALCVVYELFVALTAWIPYFSLLLSPLSVVEGIIILPAFILAIVFGIIGTLLAGKEKKRAQSLGASAPGIVGLGKALGLIAILLTVLCVVVLVIKLVIGLLLTGGALVYILAILGMSALSA